MKLSLTPTLDVRKSAILSRPAHVAVCLTTAIGVAFAAYNFPCNWKTGFVMDPTNKQRVGYLTDFNGLGLKSGLAADLSVFAPPFNNKPIYSRVTPDPSSHVVKAVAILENISWNGGVLDAISISCYMSSENANLLKTLKQMTLKTNAITTLGFWTGNYDVTMKTWFDEFYPKSSATIVAQLNAPSKNDVRLNVADTPVKVAPNININVYNVYFEVIPAANQTATLSVNASSTSSAVRLWGL